MAHASRSLQVRTKGRQDNNLAAADASEVLLLFVTHALLLDKVDAHVSEALHDAGAMRVRPAADSLLAQRAKITLNWHSRPSITAQAKARRARTARGGNIGSALQAFR